MQVVFVRHLFQLATLLLAFLCPQMSLAQASILSEQLRDCAQIENEGERLHCYDALTKRADSQMLEKGSYLERRWELDESQARGRFTLIPHRDNYLMPLTYNGNRYHPAGGLEYPVKDVDSQEVKYQISLKTKLWQDVLGENLDLWFAYTQKSFWQLYNFAESAPFRETNYEPELLLNLRLKKKLLGVYLRTLVLSVNHQSNGRSEPLSRSWNRLVAALGFERGAFSMVLKGWYRIPEGRDNDDNPNIDDYLGLGEIQSYFRWRKHRFGLLLRNNFQSHHNRSSFLFDWSFPLMQKIGLYLQYFNGYGENLLDYNQYANRIGIGFILMDWD